MIRELGRTVTDAVFENLGRAAGRVQETSPLPVDLLEGDDAYLAVFDAPGANASDVQVRYVDDCIEVRIDRFREFYDEFDMRYPGRGLSLSGSVTLPSDDLDTAGATATMEDNGTLKIRVPKAESATSGAEFDSGGEWDSENAGDAGDESDEE